MPETIQYEFSVHFNGSFNDYLLELNSEIEIRDIIYDYMPHIQENQRVYVMHAGKIISHNSIYYTPSNYRHFGYIMDIQHGRINDVSEIFIVVVNVD